MQRTNVIQLMPSKKQEKILRECMLLSSCVYNITNYKVRQQIFAGERVSNFFDLQQKVQHEADYQRLGRSYALPRIQVYSETNSAMFKLIKSKTQRMVGLPKYLKNRKTNTTLPSYLVMDGCQYAIGKERVTLPLSRQLRKEYGVKQFKIKYNGVLRWQGAQLRGQVHFEDDKFYLYQALEVKDPVKVASDVFAGIDLGIKRLFAITTSTSADKIIGSKRHYEQWLHLSGLIAKERSRLELCAGRKTSKKLSRLFLVRAKYQENLYNNLVNKTVKFLIKHGVCKVFVGDVAHILDDADFGRSGNKMLHNYWAFDKIYRKLANKCEEHGIEMEKQDESYTSQTCPVCGIADRANKKDRLFLCGFCGFFGDRDLVGSSNILVNGMHGQWESVHQGEAALLRGCSNAIA